MYCTSCGQSINPKAEICVKCGVRQNRVHNYCSECGAGVNEQQDICLGCGVKIKKAITINAPSTALEPWVAILIALFIPGLAQIIMGQLKKGLAIIIGIFVIGFFTFGIGGFIANILNIVDAYKIAKKRQAGIPVDEWEFF